MRFSLVVGILLTIAGLAGGSAFANSICYASLYGSFGAVGRYPGCGPTPEGAAGSALSDCNQHMRQGQACDELSTIMDSCQADTVQQAGFVCYSNMYVGDNVGQVVAGYGINPNLAAGNALNACNSILRPGAACDDIGPILATCTPTTLNSCQL